MTTLDKFSKGDIRALARIVSYVENRFDGYQSLMGKLYPKVGGSIRIGVTGPPGAGKSTLVNGLARLAVKDGKKVGIIAVDPSSPFSGGALLGDRVRMNELPTDGSVFFRSMATRGATGGLAAATNNVAIVYDAFGFDLIIIETVGVGQVELDVVDSCDSVVVVLVPESGDAVQTMKAGLMEIADIFCINKCDRPGAERIAADLRHMLELRKPSTTDWKIPVIQTSAIKDEKIDKLSLTINQHIEFITQSGHLTEHRTRQLTNKVLSIIKNRFQLEFLENLAVEKGLDKAVEKILAGETDPYRVADNFFEKFNLKS